MDAKRFFGNAPASRIRRIYDILSEVISPDSDLEYSDNFELLIAVILSAQATDVSVNAATAKLYPIANTPQAIYALGVAGITPYIRHIGLYNAKAKNVIECCRLLIERHQGEVPSSRAELEALPGVGRKTASVVLNIAFGQPEIAVDTHVHRVSQRLAIANCKTPEQTEKVLLKRTPRKHLLHAHHYLILFGRYTCVARQPKCHQCPLTRLCHSSDKILK